MINASHKGYTSTPVTPGVVHMAVFEKCFRFAKDLTSGGICKASVVTTKMRKLLSALLLLTLSSSGVSAQDNFYFNKWKARNDIKAESVILVMDLVDTPEGAAYNMKLGTLIAEQLKSKSIRTAVTFNKDTTQSNAVILKFSMIEPAYVQLTPLTAKIPLCNRFSITQLSKRSKKKKRLIETLLAISVDKEQEGLSQASSAFADLVSRSIDY